MSGKVLAIVFFVIVASCGVDGPPTAPQAEPAVTVTGEAAAGVVLH